MRKHKFPRLGIGRSKAIEAQVAHTAIKKSNDRGLGLSWNIFFNKYVLTKNPDTQQTTWGVGWGGERGQRPDTARMSFWSETYSERSSASFTGAAVLSDQDYLLKGKTRNF